MKNILITLASLTASLSAQVTIAHWDFVDGIKEGTDGRPASDTLAAEASVNDCITVFAANPNELDYSTSTADSENNGVNGADCFVGWDTATDGYVGFKASFASIAVGSITELNFDIANYRSKDSVRHLKSYNVEIWKNGAKVGTTADAGITGTADTHWPGNATYVEDGLPWTADTHQTIDVSSYGLSSASGSTDTFEFRIKALADANTNGLSAIALDNVRMVGSVSKVPEPSSVILLGLGSLAMTIRRKR